ncbi:hypothetical protein EXE53_20495 [Halorubrum sp. SD626R]|uniref:hypothetical protein n=1 Tax=Halorubrum sp. SD626R TaxID=1419722 RepID=UPI0010F8EBE1|nr:hypothetical protein [Halorubrum sp. SD626R]TKX78575.1 hypothetical protein EXE53_20495 [Halorubrum sp. SD626R]
MTTTSQDRLLGLAVLALLAAVGGDLLGTALLTRVGVTGFFLAVAALLAVMTVTLVVGLTRASGPDMRDSVVTRP